jgi:hypothetical protein
MFENIDRAPIMDIRTGHTTIRYVDRDGKKYPIQLTIWMIDIPVSIGHDLLSRVKLNTII